MSSVPSRNRHTRARPCRICGGADQDPRGQGKRCSGYLSTDETYEHCSREEHAGSIEQADTGLYPHRLNGSCKCGTSHGPELPRTGTFSTVEATYDYTEEHGVVLYRVIRFAGKKFRQRRPDGAGGWGYSLDGVRRVPYHLPQLLAADPARTVYLVEGEKDVESLERIGEVATTTAQGAMSWRLSADEMAKALKGRRVAIIRDNDENGAKYARAAEATLRSVVAHLDLYECPPPHKDVSDLLGAGGALAQLVPTPAMVPEGSRVVESASWESLLLLSGSADEPGPPRRIAANAITILAHHPEWEGVLAYDEFAETIVTRKIPPWRPQDAPSIPATGDWTDEDTIRVQSWLADKYRLDLGIEATLSAVKVASARAHFHPVREWLQSLKWDAKRRVKSWLHDILGCDDTPYVREVGSAFMIAAVARVMQPGCKVDTVLILEGEQGTFKSSTLRALAGDDWFLEMAITDVANKDAMQVLRRKWIAELPEIDGLSKIEATHVKAYFSRQVDTYRPSYGKGTRDFPRQTVFAGSTNQTGYLGDETGARRFHPVRCRLGNVALARELRDQLWAEAFAVYESGVQWHVSDPELAATFQLEQDERFRTHPWEEVIAAWLGRPVDIPIGKTRAQAGVTTKDVLEGALSIEVAKQTQGDANRVAACLRRLGWHQARQSRRNGIRVRLFFPAESQTALDEEQVSGVVPLLPPEASPPGWPSDDEMAAAAASED